MGGELSMDTVRKELLAQEKTREMVRDLDIGIQVGKDDARKDIEKLIAKWKDEEKHVHSYSLFLERILLELTEQIDSYKLKTVPWEQAKKELELAQQLSKGSV